MTQPEALRLADALEDDLADYSGQSLPRISQNIADNAADVLRRLHAENARLTAQRDALLEALKGLVAWADDLRRDDPVEDLRKARAAIKAVEETK